LLHWPISVDRIYGFSQCYARLKHWLTSASYELEYSMALEIDGVSRDTRAAIEFFCQKESIDLHVYRQGPDLGGIMNYALDTGGRGKNDYVMLVQDDMRLDRPLYLDASCNLLIARPEIDLIRYGWAKTKFTGPVEGAINHQWVDMQGPQPYADEPHLRRCDRRWYYSAGMGHGQQESHLAAQMVKANAKIVATSTRAFQHAGIPSCLESRR